jgi:hypothetical protein
MTTGTKLRFQSADAVYQAFPTLGETVAAEPSAVPPLEFLQALAAGGTPEDAIAFAAYMLPRREAVWWTTQCVRAIAPPASDTEDKAIKIAEAWVREPEEHRRRAALDQGLRGDKELPGTWAALAAAWSGGPMLVGEVIGPNAPPHLTAVASRNAILIALARSPPAERMQRLKLCVDGATKLSG